MSERYEIHVKAATASQGVGDCPFSQFASMVALMKIPKSQYKLILVDLNNKPKEFLDLNPEGTVPVYVDTSSKKVIPGSDPIVKEIDKNFQRPDMRVSYEGPAIEACSGVFPKFATLMKNKDLEAIPSLRQALETELAKVDSFLKSADSGTPFLLGPDISAIDCSLLPKLRHVQVAGKFFQNFEIPAHLTALHNYIKAGEAHVAFQGTLYPDEEVIKGWERHGCIKVE